jgi:hypothetical protein
MLLISCAWEPMQRGSALQMFKSAAKQQHMSDHMGSMLWCGPPVLSYELVCVLLHCCHFLLLCLEQQLPNASALLQRLLQAAVCCCVVPTTG